MSGADRRIKLTWLVLVALTLVGSGIAESVSAHRFVITVIFLLAAAKALVVATEFMEVGHAAPHWRMLYTAWILLIATMLAVGNLMG